MLTSATPGHDYRFTGIASRPKPELAIHERRVRVTRQASDFPGLRRKYLPALTPNTISQRESVRVASQQE
jgi:hypothetical protein